MVDLFSREVVIEMPMVGMFTIGQVPATGKTEA